MKRERLPDAETKGPCSLKQVVFCSPGVPVDTTMSTNPRIITYFHLMFYVKLPDTWGGAMGDRGRSGIEKYPVL